MIRISGFTDEITNDFEQQLIAAKKIGLTYISIRGVDNENIADCSIEKIKNRVLPLCEKHQISISSIGSPIGKIFINDTEAYMHELTRAQHICEIAKLLSCKFIRIFSFYTPTSNNDLNVTNKVIEKLKPIIEVIKENKLIAILENEKDTYCETAINCKRLLEGIDYCTLKIAFDFANFVQCNEDPIEAYTLLSDKVSYFHIKDAKWNGLNVVCGKGDGKIKEILYDAIVKNNYCGFLTLEPHLAIFDTLAKLELKKPEEIIPINQAESGYQAFEFQFAALKKILTSINNRGKND